MNNLKQNLYITYSKQKARELKSSKKTDALDKIVTLEDLIVELFEKNSFKIIIESHISSSIIYKIIQDHNIVYFDYLDKGALGLGTISDFIITCKRDDIAFAALLDGKKLEAVSKISEEYESYKQKNVLADLYDIEQTVLDNWDSFFDMGYAEIYVDSFVTGGISFIRSKKQELILEKLSNYKKISLQKNQATETKIIKPAHEVFDSIDEVKTALRIARKLLEDGEESNQIVIVASAIQEYAPLFRLFLNEYELKGFSSIGTPISAYDGVADPKVKAALNEYNLKVQSLQNLYDKLNLTLSTSDKEKLKESITVADERIGIELTEPNQLVGLERSYRHIIFIGTDINHFPPKASDNFLYSYDDAIKYFYANSYFKSSQTQLDELKRLSENLYIITAHYSDKRELHSSILIDDTVDKIINISDIKSVSDLALQHSTVVPDTKTQKYYKSITSEKLTSFDGENIGKFNAEHLSASQINKYLSCPLAYLYSNKIRVNSPREDEEGFDVMEQGSLMHLCYELFGRYIKDNHITTIDRDELYNIMYDISIEAYNHKDTLKNRGDENIHHQIFLSTLQAGLQDERKAGLLAKFVDYYIEKAQEFEYFKNSEFEKEFLLDDNLQPTSDENSYFIRGFIDRFDNLKEHINIIDYKSKKMHSKIDREKMQQIAELKDVQLALYILYASQEYPKKEYISHLLSFKGNGSYFHFANLSNIEKLKDTEYYSREYEEELKELIFSTKRNVEEGRFGFDNSDEKVCGYCDIKYICHESILNKII